MKKLPKIGLTGLAAAAICAAAFQFAATNSSAHPLDGEPRFTPRIKKGMSIRLENVATGLTAPNWAASSPFDDSLLVSDQTGILWSIDTATGNKSVLLNLSDRLVDLGFAGPGTFDERGFLGFAFHPVPTVGGGGATYGLYTYTSEPGSGEPDFPVPPPPSTDPMVPTTNHESVIAEWDVFVPEDTTSPVSVTLSRELLRIGQPQFNHNGGAVQFDSAGLLYIGLGDGGAGDDQSHGHNPAIGNGQDTSNVLGSILRIDPLGTNSANGEYGIPSGNAFEPDLTGTGPFGGVSGCGDMQCDEIYAYGFRNPFRFSVDSSNNLYVGDVGQNDIEEVSLVTAAGQNFGWRIKEGSLCFDDMGENAGDAFEPDPITGLCPGEDPGTLTDPIAEFDTHIDGHSVIGGFVYPALGGDIPGLGGHYVFGDFSKVFVFTFNDTENTEAVIHVSASPGRLFYLDGPENNILEFKGATPTGVVLGIGQDSDGELYVLGNATGLPFGTSGTVDKIVPGKGGKPN